MRKVTILVHDSSGSWRERYEEGKSFFEDVVDLNAWALQLVRQFNSTRRSHEAERFIDDVLITGESKMTKQDGIKMIEDLIDVINKEEDDLAIDLLEEMSDRSDSARDVRQEEVDNRESEDDDAEDLEDEDGEEEAEKD